LFHRIQNFRQFYACAGDAALNGADVINVVSKAVSASDKKAYLDKTRALLLGTLFFDSKLYARFREKITEDMFEKNIHKTIFNYIKESFAKGEKVSNTGLIGILETEDDIKEAYGILALDIQSDDTVKAVTDYINQINDTAGPEKAYELLKAGKITLEEFNKMLSNKG